MNTKNTRQGFTLIELLVVVLIIGILAAVAVPQYQKSVEKAKAVQALTLVRSTAQAIENYYLANGVAPTSFDELALDIPWPTGGKAISSEQDSRSNGEWTLGIGTGAVVCTRLQGKYKGAGFMVLFRELRPVCFERKSGSDVLFDSSLADGSYCQKIMNGTLNEETGYFRNYTLP